MFYIRVIDRDSSEPVEGVVVRLRERTAPYTIGAEGMSGEDGLVYLEVPEGTWWLSGYMVGRGFPAHLDIEVTADMDPTMGWELSSWDLNPAPGAPNDAALCRLYGVVCDPSGVGVPAEGIQVSPIWPRKYRGRLVVSGTTHRADNAGQFRFELVRGGVYSTMLQGMEHRFHVPDLPTAPLAEVMLPEVASAVWDAEQPGLAEVSLAVGDSVILSPQVTLTSGDVVPFTWGDTLAEEALTAWVTVTILSGEAVIQRSLGARSLELTGVAAGVAILRIDRRSDAPSGVPGVGTTGAGRYLLTVTVGG